MFVINVLSISRTDDKIYNIVNVIIYSVNNTRV